MFLGGFLMEDDEKVTRDSFPLREMHQFLEYGRRHVEFEDVNLRRKEKKRLERLSGGPAETRTHIRVHKKACIKDDLVKRRGADKEFFALPVSVVILILVG
jgi:hypothetical protein